MKLSKTMTKLGVSEVDTNIYPRLIVAITGHDKRGKTHFALTAPSPTLIISSDIGTEGVVHKFVDEGKEIYEYRWSLPSKQEGAREEWAKMAEVYDNALKEKDLRTIIIDTESETWELLRLWKFGKLEKVPSYKYGEVNAIAERMYKQAYQQQKNLILIRKFKKAYKGSGTKDNYWDGTYEPSGYKNINYIAQAIIESDRHPRTKNEKNPDFFLTVTNCRHKSELMGEVLEGPMCSFPFLAHKILPEVDFDHWEG